MKEIQDILFLICSQIYKQANALCTYMYTIAGSEQVFDQQTVLEGLINTLAQ